MHDLGTFVKEHKMPVIIICVVLGGFIIYSFIHKPATPTATAGTRAGRQRVIVRYHVNERGPRGPRGQPGKNGETTTKKATGLKNAS